MAGTLFIVPDHSDPAAYQVVSAQLDLAWQYCQLAAESSSQRAAYRAIAFAHSHLVLARYLDRTFSLTEHERSVIAGKYLSCTCALAVLDLEIARNCYDPDPRPQPESAFPHSIVQFPLRHASHPR